jgi:hypothetical protein
MVKIGEGITGDAQGIRRDSHIDLIYSASPTGVADGKPD